jgi:TonB family protein
MSASSLRSPERIGLIGSGAVHLLMLLGLFLVARSANEPAPLVYAVNLVAAPAPGPTPRRAAEAALPARVEEPEAPPVKQQPRETPRQPEPEPAKAPVRDEKPVPTRSETTPLPGQAPSTGTDELTFRQEGLRFPYPDYLERIVTEIRRRWSNPSGNSRLEAVVAFTIQRDGSVTDISFVKRSNNLLFNAEARGAIERAGQDRAFGPLPSGWSGESLPIAFSFKPEQ